MERATSRTPIRSAIAALAATGLTLLAAAGCDGDLGASAVGYCDPSGCYACADGNRQRCWPLQHDRCATDVQCRNGEVCTNIGCTKLCHADFECQTGEYCAVGGSCAPRGVTVGPPATANPPTGQTGGGGGGTPNGRCAVTTDCPLGQLCAGGACATPPQMSCGIVAVVLCNADAQCGPGRSCVGGGCHVACKASSDCPVGQACASSLCSDGAPAVAQCLWDQDCGGAARCINATCHPLCATSTQCARAEFCDSGVCRADSRPAR